MIRLEKLENKIGIVYLDNPPLNVLTLEMTQQIISLCNEIENDDDIRAIVITGAGEKAFCAGANIKEFVAVRDQVIEKKLKEENRALLKIEKLSKPVIAAMDGIVLGGGCEIALACDIRVIAEDVKIGLPEINLGVFPGSGGIYRLPKVVGMSNALELMYTGDMLTAEEAYRIGLVNHITPSKGALDLAKTIAGKIATKPKHALKAIKEGVRNSLEISQEEAIQETLELSDQVFKTSDCQEGIDAFFEKRQPQFN
ncbi:enoyl-CoA hydratase/isomerase family protein [Priestia megaterium]